MTREHDDHLERLCAAWGCGPAVTVAPLAAGFSGVAVHMVTLADAPGRFVLKSFAPWVPPERAAWVHGLMRHARDAGVLEVPDVLVSAAGSTVVADGDRRCWELVRFVEGRSFESPTPVRAAAALDALARLHLAVESWPSARPDVGPSAGVERRIRQAGELLSRPWWRQPVDAVDHRETAEFAAAVSLECRDAGQILHGPLGRRGLTAVAEARIRQVHRQAVVRDIWSDHVLFDPTVPGRVAGFIDFQAAGIDTPMTDVARLLGSWRSPHAPHVAAGLTGGWADPLAAYERARGTPLTRADRWLCDWLHAAAVICSLDNWFRWVLVENRRFVDARRALMRIRGLVADLGPAVEWLAHAGNQPV